MNLYGNENFAAVQVVGGEWIAAGTEAHWRLLEDANAEGDLCCGSAGKSSRFTNNIVRKKRQRVRVAQMTEQKAALSRRPRPDGVT